MTLLEQKKTTMFGFFNYYLTTIIYHQHFNGKKFCCSSKKQQIKLMDTNVFKIKLLLFVPYVKSFACHVTQKQKEFERATVSFKCNMHAKLQHYGTMYLYLKLYIIYLSEYCVVSWGENYVSRKF